MTNGDKIIDTLVDNAAGALKRAVRKALNGIFVDKEHSKPFIEDGNGVKEYASSNPIVDFDVNVFNGGWAPMDNWPELSAVHLEGFMKWEDVIKEEDGGLPVKDDVYIYTYKFKGTGPRLVLLEQFCNELDMSYDEYEKIILTCPSLIPVLIPHGDFQKTMFNREAEYNEDLLEPHYLVPVSGLVMAVMNIRFTSTDAITFKRTLAKTIGAVANVKVKCD